jgi:N-acylglucosamine-6-phosphate 2-epimerase
MTGLEARIEELKAQIQGGLIVSCQALPDEPLHGATIMARMALAAKIGGAVAIRANGPDDIAAIRAAVALPIVGLWKDGTEGVYITPTLRHARAVIDAGADVVALDATARPRPGGESLDQIVATIQNEWGVPVLADVSTLDEALIAQQIGAALVSTTLSGYTPYSSQHDGPDLDLVRGLAGRLRVPLIAEGRIHTPEQARAALEAGAFAVVVGGAITRPQQITARFVAGINAATQARALPARAPTTG